MNILEITADGSHTIYVPELNEHYHSIHGAIQESLHIFIKNGFEFSNADPIHIFEVGFGTGLNALLTALKCIETGRMTYYTTIEKYPLEADVVSLLNYNQFTGSGSKEIFDRIHKASWGKMENISGPFHLQKICDDITSLKLSGTYDLIYFDAFAPDKQPELWNSRIFADIADITSKNGILVTYTSKGSVRRNLMANGFTISRLPGPPGKRHIIRAVKF